MNEQEAQALRKIRNQIDALDYHIHDLLNQRGELAIEVCKIKKTFNEKIESFVRPEREQEIFTAISAYNKGPLNNEAILRIFRVIIDESIRLQQESGDA